MIDFLYNPMGFILFIDKHYSEKAPTGFISLAKGCTKFFFLRTPNPYFQDYGLQGNPKVQGRIMYVKESSEHNIWTLHVEMFHRLWSSPS